MTTAMIPHNNNEEVRKVAINNILDADGFIAISVKNSNLTIATTVSTEVLSTMILSMMRHNPDYANSVTMAALAYAQEQMLNKSTE